MMDFRGLLFNEYWAGRVELGVKLRPFGTGEDRRMASEEAIRAASEEVSQQFKTLINIEEVESIKQTQHLILGRLQDSNAVLSHFNEYSERCFTEVSGDFSRNTRLLKSIKSDLDYIFMKLRSMKSRLKGMYPDAFPDDSTIKILDQRPDLEKPLPYRE